MNKGGREAIDAAEAIGKLPLDKLPVDAVIIFLDPVKTLLEKGGREAYYAADVLVGLVKKVSFKHFNLFIKYLDYENLPELVDHLSNNIASISINDFKNIDDIENLLQFVKDTCNIKRA